jgi:hypothetical protein
VGLFAQDGKLLHDSDVEIDLIPAGEKLKPAGVGGMAQRLIE